MITKFMSLFTRFTAKSMLETCIFAVVLIALWLLVARIKSPWKKLPIAVLVILTLRFLMFGNPFVWMVYGKLVDISTMDQRLGMILNYKIKEDQRVPKKVHYLALGTSQMNALFNEYIVDHDYVTKKGIAGMLPNEYFLCRSFVDNSPDTLILYLSEVDFCKMPNFTSLYILPEQYFDWLQQVHILQTNYPGTKLPGNPWKLILNDFTPEFKYRMILRHIALNLVGLDENQRKTKDTTLESHLKNLTKLRDDGLIRYQMDTFERFIRTATSRGKTIILCEGMYNPLGLSDKNLYLKQKVNSQLEALCHRHPHMYYIPRSDQYQLQVEDFYDGYHVKNHPGYLWVDYFFKNIVPAIKQGKYNTPKSNP